MWGRLRWSPAPRHAAFLPEGTVNPSDCWTLRLNMRLPPFHPLLLLALGTLGGCAAEKPNTGGAPGVLTLDPEAEAPETGSTEAPADSGEAGMDEDTGGSMSGEAADVPAPTLTDVWAEDEDGDGRWRAGEALYVHATAWNPDSSARSQPLSLALSSDHPGVYIPEPSVALDPYGAEESSSVSWWALAPAECEAAEVNFRVALLPADCPTCPPVAEVILLVGLEP